jgi:RES domain-containing protein
MGRAKDLMIQEDEQGWHFVGGVVCAQCFTDEAIRQFIEGQATATTCDYCGRSADQPIAAEMDDVLEVIANGIFVEWSDAVDELPYESAEGGYQGQTYDSRELFGEIIGFPTRNPRVIEAILEAFRDRLWCQRNYFRLNEQDRLLLGWEEFCDELKHQRRYFFYEPTVVNSENDPLEPPTSFDERETLTPTEVLQEIEQLVGELALATSTPEGHVFARARRCDPPKDYKTAAELGAPPTEKAIYANRMSPAGIPMFYGAEETDTAVAEIADGPGDYAIGMFETVRELRLLDLTELPETPSYFIAEMAESRIRITFLKRFVRDLRMPVEKDGREHIEYVPTQVVTEYFRHVYRDKNGRSLDGILYPSAKKPGGTNCVLFCENDGCSDTMPSTGWERDRIWLRLKEVHRRTVAKPKKIRTKRLK